MSSQSTTITINDTFFGIPHRWIVILSGALFYAYQFVIRVAPNLMIDDWMSHFAIDAKSYGFIISLYSWSYAIIQIPLGLMMDRIGAGRLMVFGAFLCAASCFMLSMTGSNTVAACAMFLIGLGSASAFLGSIKLGTMWFSTNDLAKVVALVIVFGTIGGAIGNRPLSALILNVGWQNTFSVLGIAGLLIALVMYVAIVRTPEPKSHDSLANSKTFQMVFEELRLLLTRPQAWFIAMYGMFMYSPITIYGTAWGNAFVKTAADTDNGMASWVMTVMLFGAGIGSPIFAYYSDKICQRVKPMYMGAVLVEMVKSGHRAAMVYVVQREDGGQFSFAEDLDPVYAETARLAFNSGVEAYVYPCSMGLEGISLLPNQLKKVF